MSERRRYFKVGDSVLHERWSNDELATIIRLQAYMHERWARDGLTPEEAETVVLSQHAVLTIAGTMRPARAHAILASLASKITMTVTVDAGPPALVYFLLDNDTGFVKIGYSSNLIKRLRTLRGIHPNIELLAYIETIDAQVLERQLHRQFARLRSHGEWFNHEPELKEFYTLSAHPALAGDAPFTPRALARHTPSTRVYWPKFPKFQGLPSRNGAEVDPPNPNPKPKPNRVPSEPRERGASPGGGNPKRGNPQAPKGNGKAREKCPPADFVPDETTMRVATELGYSDALERAEREKFIDYEFKDGKTKWQATYRNWLRNSRANPSAQRFQNGNGRPPAAAGSQTAAQRSMDNLHLFMQNEPEDEEEDAR